MRVLFGQLVTVPGSESYGAAGDSYHDRLRYMEQCLDSLSNLKVRPRLRSVACPHNTGMGCGMEEDSSILFRHSQW